MKADFICTLNKLLEEKHIHFNAYCWILKYVFPYIKNSFKKKKMNLVFAPKLCWPWELALCNVMCLKQLGSWYRCWGCRSGRWFRGAPRTHVAPPFPSINPEAPCWLPLVQWSISSSGCRGPGQEKQLGQSQPHTPQTSFFVLVCCKSS